MGRFQPVAKGSNKLWIQPVDATVSLGTLQNDAVIMAPFANSQRRHLLTHKTPPEKRDK
jgi:hypothetical protein